MHSRLNGLAVKTDPTVLGRFTFKVVRRKTSMRTAAARESKTVEFFWMEDNTRRACKKALGYIQSPGAAKFNSISSWWWLRSRAQIPWHVVQQSGPHHRSQCQDASVTCIMLGRRAPISPMKTHLYQFDWKPGVDDGYLDNFVTRSTNMAAVQVTIIHEDSGSELTEAGGG